MQKIIHETIHYFSFLWVLEFFTQLLSDAVTHKIMRFNYVIICDVTKTHSLLYGSLKTVREHREPRERA